MKKFTVLLSTAALLATVSLASAASSYNTTTGQVSEADTAWMNTKGAHYEGGVNAGATDIRPSHNPSAVVTVKANLAACCNGKPLNDRDEYGNLAAH